MSKLTWSEFIDLHPVGHMLIGVTPDVEMTKSTRPLLNLMARLLARVAKGEYALAVSRQGTTLEIHCAFEQKSDAKKVGDTLGAYHCVGYPSGASRRWVKLDAPACETIGEMLQAA